MHKKILEYPVITMIIHIIEQILALTKKLYLECKKKDRKQENIIKILGAGDIENYLNIGRESWITKKMTITS